MSNNTQIEAKEKEEDVQLELLAEPVGTLNSGLTRYAAAMYFYQRGALHADALEVYRICSPFDDEDPLAALQRHGLARQCKLIRSRPETRS